MVFYGKIEQVMPALTDLDEYKVNILKHTNFCYVNAACTVSVPLIGKSKISFKIKGHHGDEEEYLFSLVHEVLDVYAPESCGS